MRFVTPTELKGSDSPAAFATLFSRIRDRISTLRALYGPGPLEIEFRDMAERAACVEMPRCELQWERVERRSSRTGQSHSLGGFLGEAEYSGDLAEFLPYLDAARWTGVGRQTVWGKGEIETRVICYFLVPATIVVTLSALRVTFSSCLVSPLAAAMRTVYSPGGSSRNWYGLSNSST